MHNYTYTSARAQLAKVMDEAVETREAVRITRRGKNDVVMMAADEYDGIIETLHLLRSPRNAVRLMESLKRAKARKGRPQPVEEFRAEVGLGEDE